jgi:hypothetical protein
MPLLELKEEPETCELQIDPRYTAASSKFEPST